MNKVVQSLRAGTKPHSALLALQGLAGQASKPEWRKAMGWKYSLVAFDQDVIFLLSAQRLVFRRGDTWCISDDGQRLIGIDPDAFDSEPGLPVRPREAVACRPLSRSNMPRMDMAREGSLDFQNISSRYGDTLVPHRKA